jgi:hypothetical protein
MSFLQAGFKFSPLLMFQLDKKFNNQPNLSHRCSYFRIVTYINLSQIILYSPKERAGRDGGLEENHGDAESL